MRDEETVATQLSEQYQWRCPECGREGVPELSLGRRGLWRVSCRHCECDAYVPGPEALPVEGGDADGR